MTTLHSDFVHLHLHTQYSLLDGACRIPELVNTAVELRMPALAITDHGNLFGAIEFYETCMKAGLKPIIGCEMYVAPRSRFDRTAGDGGKEPTQHLTLLARDEEGYRNLIQLVTIGYLEGFYYKPRIDKEVLAQHAGGLLGLSGCLRGVVNVHLTQDQPEHARRAAGEFAEILGRDNFYLELHDHGMSAEAKVRDGLLRLSRELSLPLVATNDVHYLLKDHWKAHDALIAIQTQTTLDNPHRMRYEPGEFCLKSAEEMQERFREHPEAISNTLIIAERCNLELDFKQVHMPTYDPPTGQAQDAYLHDLCQAGLKTRFGGAVDYPALQRLEQELQVIAGAGYTSYFLIVWDFVRYAKQRGIPVGPGRGSAAGSLVSYALGITDIDPLKYGLIFERFLNPQRVSLPDIDIDFCFERRGEVIDYVVKKYGADHVAQIITFGTMQARAVVRDVGRVMNMPYGEVDKIAKMIPFALDMTLARALAEVAELAQMYQENPTITQLIDTSRVLEGLTRHASTHAAGIAIADAPLTAYMPLFKTSDGVLTTGFPMNSLEHIKILKIDLLGLRTLTVIDETLKLLQQTRNLTLNIDTIPLDDAATYALLASAETMGVFQLESGGMRDLLQKLQPTQFEDLIALLALYRPGPIGSGMLDDFIKRKRGEQRFNFDHPKLAPILKETHGILVYQEQVMRIANELAGFSLARADLLRRAMGKKIPEVMERERQGFLDGCVKQGVPKRVAEKTFTLMEHFAGYGFNKSHSTAYAMISYRTAFLKANYPLEFMTALLTSELGNTDKVVAYVSEAKRLGFHVRAPDVNTSSVIFTAADAQTIRFGLAAIKNVGRGAIEAMVAARLRGGRFNSLFEFCERLDSRLVNRKVIESLIKAGALDSVGGHRAQLMAQLAQAMDLASAVQADRSTGQLSLFDASPAAGAFQPAQAEGQPVREWPEHQRLLFEKELLGFYISGHPLARYEALIAAYANTATAELAGRQPESAVIIGGLLSKIKHTLTKRTNEAMAICHLEDLQGEVEMLVFPKAYPEASKHLRPNAVVFVRGTVSQRDDQPRLIADEVIPAEQAKWQFAKSLELTLATPEVEELFLRELQVLLAKFPGSLPVYLTMPLPEQREPVRLMLGRRFAIAPSPPLINALEGLLGPGSVQVK